MAITVVIAEGCTLVREGLAHLMAKANVRPVEAASYLGACVRVREAQPDVMLMSNELAGMDALKYLKREMLELRVVLYSPFSECSFASARKMAEAGVCGYVGRDTDVGLLVEVVKHVASGGTFFPEEMIEQLFDELARGSPAHNRNTLTPREAEVLYLVQRGCSNKEIAKELGISEATAHSHVRALMQKIGVHKRIKLAVYAEKHIQRIGAVAH
ncbi:MAG: response regulator transcription factor [Candidatus Wildermuthbacteria bacterium]|nr:response regulator transcription factor [Candidatus Wildermuthbacteria bacterium]